MKKNKETMQHPRIQDYLSSVSKTLRHQPAAMRERVKEDLVRHFHDALQDLGRKPTDEDIDILLAGMDPPECFLPPGDAWVAQRQSRRGPPGWLWFALALSFLILNGWVVSRMLLNPVQEPVARRPPTKVEFSIDAESAVEKDTALIWTFSRDMVAETGTVLHRAPVTIQPSTPGRFTWEGPRTLVFRPAGEWPLCHNFEASLDETLLDLDGYPVGGEKIFHFYTEGLQLLAMEQADLDSQRRVTIRLRFNAPPDRESLRRSLQITDDGARLLEWHFLGDAPVADVHVRTQALSTDRLTILLDPVLRPAAGTRGLSGFVERALVVSDNFQFRRLQPSTPARGDPTVTAYFSEHLAIEHAAGFIEVRPETPFSISSAPSWDGGGCVLQGSFEPGGTYTVLFRAGLPSRNGSVLTRDIERSVHLPDRPPSLFIPLEGRYLSPRGSLRIPFTAVNIRGVQATMQPVPAVNLVPFTMRETGRYSNYWWDGDDQHADSLGGVPMAPLKMDTAGPLNEAVQGAVDIRRWIGESPRGIWLLNLADERGGRTASRLVVLTDLALSVRMADGDAWVWVTSLSDALPVAGAEVTMWSDNNEALFSARTDERGLAHLPLPGRGTSRPPLLVTAAYGEDLSYLSLIGSELPVSEHGTRPFLGTGYEAYLFTDRGIYRPGETVVLRTLIRDSSMDAPVKTFPVQFRIYRPDGRLFHERTVVIDDSGAAGIMLDVPEYARTGRYSAQLTLPGGERFLGSTDISVEEFVPPQIEVKAEGPKTRVSPPDAVAFRATARHLFGRAALGLPVEGFVSYEPAAFRPANWSGWLFGDDEKVFPPSWRNLGSSFLDDDGAMDWNVTIDKSWRPPAALRLVFRATVMEHGGRPVSAYAATDIDIYPYYIGLKSDREGGHLRVDEEHALSVAVVLPDGEVESSVPRLQAVLSRVEWVNFMRRERSGSYAWVSERRLDRVDDQVIEIVDGKGKFTVNPPRPGHYLLVVSDPFSGASSSLTFAASPPDSRWVSWGRERPDRVLLKFDREEYKPGDTARMTLASPFNGTALVTLENNAVLESHVLDIEDNTAELEFTVQDHFAPNIYAHATVVRPSGPQAVWRTPRATGSAPLRVLPTGRSLKISFDAPGNIRPASTLAVDLAVRDERDQPVEADLVVFAVDEGICALTNFRSPDPLAFFLGLRLPGVRGYDLFNLLMPDIDEREAGEPSSAPGDEAELMRRLNPMNASRFRPVALYSGLLRSDASGSVVAEFDVPEFTGRLRLMAVAWTPRLAGSAAAPVTVKRPVVVQAALPRFLAPGDICQVPVSIFNETDDAITARVRLTAAGPLAVKEIEKVLELAAGAHGEPVFEIHAGELPGLAVCSVEVDTAVERYHERFEIAVRPATLLEKDIRQGVISAGEELRFSPPEGWLPGTVHHEIYAAGRPDVSLLGGLDYLLTYPYGCLEQTVSVGFPLLYLTDLATAIRPQSMGTEEVDYLVKAAINRILGMQQADGSFSAWPGSGQAYHWGSVYAIHFLAEARRSGVGVPEEHLNAALAWVRGRLDRAAPSGDDPAQLAWREDMDFRAYACHVLALAGRPEAGWTERLREQADKLTPGARAHVGAALILMGRPRDAGTLFLSGARGVKAMVYGERSTGGALIGPVRDKAMLLAAWSDLDPAHPEAMTLASLLHAAAWETTHDTAWALMALGKHLRALPERPLAFMASARLADGTQLTFDEKNALRVVSAPGEGGVILLRNDGPGDVYYTVRYEGVPVAASIPERDQGIRVRRTLMDVNGETWRDARPVRRGDLLVVRIDLEIPGGRAIDNLIVTDMLPAGLEIENPDLATAAIVPWLSNTRTPWCLHHEMRDDRLLLFTGPVRRKVSYHYALRAVTEGTFVWPPIAVEAMYDPSLYSVHGLRQLEVKP